MRDSVGVDTVKSGDIPLEVPALGQLTSETSVELAVPETAIQHVQVGQGVKVAFLNSSTLAEGRVLRIRPRVQDGTITVDVQVEPVAAVVARPVAQVDGTIQVGALTNDERRARRGAGFWKGGAGGISVSSGAGWKASRADPSDVWAGFGESDRDS
jgi:hypothetical protein